MFIDLDDYAHTAGDRGWGIRAGEATGGGTGASAATGGTTDEARRVSDPDLATVVANRSGTRIAVRTALATLICALIDWTEREDGGNYLL
ncbi:MAG: family peptidase, partial [Mycobacterium sp.]|nr:family peptidase [Mycobacterium sp.]